MAIRIWQILIAIAAPWALQKMAKELLTLIIISTHTIGNIQNKRNVIVGNDTSASNTRRKA
jgi:hypothetical protein